MTKHHKSLGISSENPLLLLLFFILSIAPYAGLSQCPGTGCTYTITGTDAGNYNVYTGEKICLEAGADFTGQIGLYGGEIQNCATNPQSFSYFINGAFPSSTFNNYGTYNITNDPPLQDGMVINNYGTFSVLSLRVNSSTEFHNFGTVITDSGVYITSNGTLINSGTIQVNNVFNIDDNTTFDHTGDISANQIILRGTWTSSGDFTSTTSFTVENTSVANLSGGLITTDDFFNNGTTNGLSCVDITATSTTNNQGTLTGSIGFVDLTPPASAPFIDVNSGTVGPDVLWTSCPGSVVEEICNNSIDDNGDGRIDEPFPGGVQTSMQLWLKAETGTNTTVDGNDVTSWGDQSINGYSADADVNSTDDPTFRENAINFNPGIDFDGIYTDGFSDGLHLGSDYIYAEKDGLHVFVVCDTDAPSGTDKYLFDFGLQPNGGYGMIYSDNDYGMYTNNSFGGVSTELFHSEGAEPALVEMKVDFDDTQEFYRNGNLLSSIPVTIPDLDASKILEAPAYGALGASSGPVSIGRKSASSFLDQDGGQLFNGRISEVIVFTDTLSSLEKQQVNSYLAVKYGLTLTQNYLSSTGSTKKDISDGYANNIAGIGRDDCSGLYQKQSKSIGSEAIVTIGQGTIAATNELNGNTIPADESYLMWGNNDAPANANWVNANVTIPGVDFSSIDRTWKFSEHFDITNALFQVEVDDPNFDLPAMPPTANGIYYLLRDDDGDFTNGGTTYQPMSLVAGDIWETMIADPANEYFTIAVGTSCEATAPTLTK